MKGKETRYLCGALERFTRLMYDTPAACFCSELYYFHFMVAVLSTGK
jgi:hypothetical protein